MKPTPYYADDRTVLYCADNADVLPYLPERCVDLVLTDPPFAEETHAGGRTHAKEPTPDPITGKRKLVGDAGVLLTFDSISEAALRTTFDRLGYIARAWVLASLDWRHYAALEHLPPAFLRAVRFGIWDKPNGAPQFTGDRPATGWECIGIFHRAGVRMAWNGGGHRAVWRCNKINDPFNPTAKPPELITTLIELFSNPGDLVFDPFAGVGTTLLCARNAGRLAVGIERSEAQCAEIVRRLRPTFGQPVRRKVAAPALDALPMFSEAA